MTAACDDPWNAAKRAIAEQTLLALPEKGTLSLGSGSTAKAFVKALANSSKRHKWILTSTSTETSLFAGSLGLAIEPLQHFEVLDLAIDGADAVDPNRRLLKGWGGACTREKLAASMADQFWVLIDPSKQYETLPMHRIPCEILPPAQNFLWRQWSKAKLIPTLRRDSTNSGDKASAPVWVSDNGGWMVDLDASEWTGSLEALAQQLLELPGVIDHGLFLNFKPLLFTLSQGG